MVEKVVIDFFCLIFIKPLLGMLHMAKVIG